MRFLRTIAPVYLLLWCVFSCLPFIWTVATSLKPPNEVASLPPSIVFEPSIVNYVSVIMGGGGGFYGISQEGFVRYAANSLLVATSSMFLTLLLGTTASYYLSRRGTNDRLLSWILSFRMMPPVAVVIPFYLMASFVGLVDSLVPLVLIYTVFNLPLVVWLMTAYMRSVSQHYDDMALVDGYTEWQAFWRVILPISRPAIMTAGLVSFIFSWNDFLFALILTGYEAKTLPVMATGFITQRGILWGQLTATAVLITLPVIVLAIMLQREFIKGITLGLKR